MRPLRDLVSGPPESVQEEVQELRRCKESGRHDELVVSRMKMRPQSSALIVLAGRIEVEADKRRGWSARPVDLKVVSLEQQTIWGLLDDHEELNHSPVGPNEALGETRC